MDDDLEKKLEEEVKDVLRNKGINNPRVNFSHPTYISMGDTSTGSVMGYAKELKIGPTELAEEVKIKIEEKSLPEIDKVVIAGPGFINIGYSRKFFTDSIEKILNDRNFGDNNLLKGKKIMVEYTDPNPFKPFHIGHLMTNAIGESIARILYHSGADVKRANYQGDVGLHVAKAIYGIQKRGIPEDMSAPVQELAKYIGDSYVLGNSVHEEDAEAKKEIDILNKKIYTREDVKVNQVYDWGFKVTMEAFEDLYKILGTKFDFYFLESNVAPVGEKVVLAHTGKSLSAIRQVFEISDGAVVFKAENFDPKLHTRVFITSAGLPTYETKELGLALEKFKTLPDMDRSIVITANEQADYMRVVAKALSLIHPEHENKLLHITHGMMRLATGKMGSRKGNIITGESLIRDTIALIGGKMKDREWSEEEKHKVAEMVGVAAIKYSILRSKAGSDIVYNVEESISVEGDSGPYLQYSYARANSILEKAKIENILPDFDVVPKEISEVEKLLYRFPEFVLRSASLYEPHHIATYLIELARAYNSFYGNTLIVDKKDKTSAYKIALTFAFSFVMKKGLYLLGIEAPEKM